MEMWGVKCSLTHSPPTHCPYCFPPQRLYHLLLQRRLHVDLLPRDTKFLHDNFREFQQKLMLTALPRSFVAFDGIIM